MTVEQLIIELEKMPKDKPAAYIDASFVEEAIEITKVYESPSGEIILE